MRKNEHRAPWECSFAKEDTSKCIPGFPPKSDREYFEILCLCILQAGLSWKIVRKNWPKIRQGFFNFNFNKLSRMSVKELMERQGVYKNESKVEAIITNARRFQNIKRDFRSFSNFLKSLKELKNKGAIKQLTKLFQRVGEYTAEYYLHCVGYWVYDK